MYYQARVTLLVSRIESNGSTSLGPGSYVHMLASFWNYTRPGLVSRGTPAMSESCGGGDSEILVRITTGGSVVSSLAIPVAAITRQRDCILDRMIKDVSIEALATDANGHPVLEVSFQHGMSTPRIGTARAVRALIMAPQELQYKIFSWINAGPVVNTHHAVCHACSQVPCKAGDTYAAELALRLINTGTLQGETLSPECDILKVSACIDIH